MTRDEKIETARRLRGEGLLLRQIGQRMGVATTTVHLWISDPDGSKARARKDSYRGTCEVCGAPTTGCNGRDAAPTRCYRHGKWATEIKPAKAKERTRQALALRRQGLLDREIAERMGDSSAHVVTDLLQRRRVARYGFEFVPSNYINQGGTRKPLSEAA